MNEDEDEIGKTQSQLQQDTSDLVSDFISSLVVELQQYSNNKTTNNTTSESNTNQTLNTTTIGILPNKIQSESFKPKRMIFALRICLYKL